ncbi:MAG: NAD(P)-dependent oxidoreductase [Polyangiaceae bacterium]
MLITGSSGLIGSALVGALGAREIEVEGFDLRAVGAARGDVCDAERLRGSVLRCDGVVHLAAVSRVVHAERDPELCRRTNVEGVRNVLDAVSDSPRRPWLVFASSREVHGQPDSLPVKEDFPLRPVNVYGQSKVEGERLIEEARRAGVRACTVRLSNVFGAVADHADRVIPAFVRRAMQGEPLLVEGADHTFDFTHTDDVARGLVLLTERLIEGAPAPEPIQLTAGEPTTLGDLAAMVVQLSGSSSPIRHAAPRAFDVTRFVGDPSRAAAVLGWRPRVSLREGLVRLVRDVRRAGVETQLQETPS